MSMSTDKAGPNSYVISNFASVPPSPDPQERRGAFPRETTRREASLPSTMSSIGSSDISEVNENGLYWEGYLDEEYIEKKHSKPIRNLRYMFFSVYRRLFGITFAVNMSVFIGLAVTSQATTGKIAHAVIFNLFVSILLRQEYVINTLFKIFTAWSLSTPLFIRRISARIFHIGGCKYN